MHYNISGKSFSNVTVSRAPDMGLAFSFFPPQRCKLHHTKKRKYFFSLCANFNRSPLSRRRRRYAAFISSLFRIAVCARKKNFSSSSFWPSSITLNIAPPLSHSCEHTKEEKEEKKVGKTRSSEKLRRKNRFFAKNSVYLYITTTITDVNFFGPKLKH